MMTSKEKFIELYRTYIHRDGSEKLLEFLMSRSSDFFEAPASTRFHGAYKGGLVDHSLNVYECLKDYLERPRVREFYGLNSVSEESIAIVALLHDICKVNVYRPSKRNVKVDGQWQSVDTFEFHDDLPYGHGEKSVYMITGFMRLTRDESFAIRYHMGFSSEYDDPRSIGYTFEHFPLAFALSTADMEATYFLEGEKK